MRLRKWLSGRQSTASQFYRKMYNLAQRATVEPQYPAMPPETRISCAECGAGQTIQRNLRGEIVYSMTQLCLGPHDINTEAANQ